jgi:hypothetical protein
MDAFLLEQKSEIHTECLGTGAPAVTHLAEFDLVGDVLSTEVGHALVWICLRNTGHIPLDDSLGRSSFKYEGEIRGEQSFFAEQLFQI